LSFAKYLFKLAEQIKPKGSWLNLSLRWHREKAFYDSAT